MTKVSIIVPFRNAKQYLERCINNLEAQKYKDYEILFIDDGSTDESKKIIENKMKNPKIKYYYINKKSRGVGKARNYGIQKAVGEYIMFVDVDDIIDDNLLNNMEGFINNGIEIIKYKMKIINNINELRNTSIDFDEKNEIITGEEGFNSICFKDKLFDSPCIYIIKKELFFINNIRFEENVYHEDFGTIPYLILKAKTMIVTNYCGYYYIQSSNSIMRNNLYIKTIDKINDKIKMYDKMKKNIEKLNVKEETKQNIKIFYANSIIIALNQLKIKDRRKYKKKIKERNIINEIGGNYLKKIIITFF